MEGLRALRVEELGRGDLARLTSLRVGGFADKIVAPGSVEELTSWLNRFSARKDFVLHVLGAGSNVLAADGHTPHYTLLTTRIVSGYYFDGQTGNVVVPSGVRMPVVARDAANLGIAGFGFLAGIPGTVGGGVFMNAGTGGLSGPSISDLVRWVDVVDTRGNLSRLTRDELQFEYRFSSFQRTDGIIARVGMRGVCSGSPDALRDEIRATMVKRKQRQPSPIRTAGSTFLPTSDGVPAGKIIDECGLKGYSVGKVRVSRKHANWIETELGASAFEVHELIRQVVQLVSSRTGIELMREIRFFPTEARRGGGFPS